MEQVNGDRKCTRCEGVCHDGSWRTKQGQRRSYWCSEQCLRAHVEANTPYTVSDESWERIRDNYERVNVVAR